MKYLFFLLTLFASTLHAQTNLAFDKRFVECEDRWVAFRATEDSTYPYGFIYVDAEAGLTLNYEGTFIILPSGEFVPKKNKEANMKVRLEPNNVKVAFIPENKFAELKIDATPDWLKYYKGDTGSIQRLYRWGYLYNAWEACAKALTYLERAQQINPKHPGLAVELAFSYNCLSQYDKAEQILEEEIRTNPTDAYVNKEYIYALSKNNKIDKAGKQFQVALKTVKDDQYNAENCYNIMQFYYNNKDKANFNKWYAVFQQQPNSNKRMSGFADEMKKEINK